MMIKYDMFDGLLPYTVFGLILLVGLLLLLRRIYVKTFWKEPWENEESFEIPLPATTEHVGNVIFSSRQERLFVSCNAIDERLPQTWIGRYRYTHEWFLCRVRSSDIDGSYTIVWEDGTLQIGTSLSELYIPTTNLSRKIEIRLKDIRKQQEIDDSRKVVVIKSDDTVSDNNKNNIVMDPLLKNNKKVVTYNDMTVWEAAKKGDVQTVLTLIDRGDATPNDVENLSSSSSSRGGSSGGDKDTEQQGRTPLYWACFIGHVELVRELLARGGIDIDGSAYLAVTSREKADDNRDLMFDPDTGTYSDWVDYPIVNSSNEQSICKKSTDQNKNDTVLIRAMLAAAKVSRSSDIETMRKRLPTKLYQSVDTTTDTSSSLSECTVCLQKTQLAIAVPCGHVSSCKRCLTASRRKAYGCPICRGQVSTIVMP